MIERLRDIPAPGEEAARRRALEVVHAARPEPRRRRRWPAVAAALAGAALVVSPAGAAVADWVRDVVEPAPAPRAASDRLPAGGRLLLTAPHGPVVVGAGRRTRLLGAVDEASWSPRGRFVAAARGPELIAVDLEGRRRWSLAGRAVRSPRWSLSGFRVAYLDRRQLRVVAGDGTGDRALGPARAVAPAWRPGARHLLAHVDAAGRVVLRDVDRRRVLWRARVVGDVAQLAFRDGRVLALTSDAVVDARSGRRVAAAGRAERLVAMAPRPGTLALVVRGPRTMRVEVGGRTLLTLAAALGTPAWSPDGRWLAVPRGATTLLLRPATGDVRTLAGGRLEGWCCPR